MNLTTELLARYIGGDVLVRSIVGNYLYRGPCMEIEVDTDTLWIRFSWLAKNGGGLLRPTDVWENTDRLEHMMKLVGHAVHELPDGCVYLDLTLTNESVVFFPPSGEKLDRRCVRFLATD